MKPQAGEFWIVEVAGRVAIGECCDGAGPDSKSGKHISSIWKFTADAPVNAVYPADEGFRAVRKIDIGALLDQPAPVSYRWRAPGNKHWTYDPAPKWMEDHKDLIEVEALYRGHPPAPELLAALKEVRGCFDAAYAEGLSERLAEADQSTGTLADLILRRLVYAHQAAISVTGEVAAGDAPGRQATDDDRDRVFTEACDEAGCAYDNEALLKAIADLKAGLQRMTGAFRPFTFKPIGAPHSPARAEQDEQKAAHAEAMRLLAAAARR
jgi:hypothetical protein